MIKVSLLDFQTLLDSNVEKVFVSSPKCIPSPQDSGFKTSPISPLKQSIYVKSEKLPKTEYSTYSRAKRRETDMTSNKLNNT